MLLNDTTPPDLLLLWEADSASSWDPASCPRDSRDELQTLAHRNTLKALVVLWCHLTRQQNLDIPKKKEIISKDVHVLVDLIYCKEVNPFKSASSSCK